MGKVRPPLSQDVEVLTVDDVAEYLRVHPMTVYRLVAKGVLHSFKVGRFWRFLRSDIVELTKKNAPVFLS
jgi:excisionase family DNA binding protein